MRSFSLILELLSFLTCLVSRVERPGGHRLSCAFSISWSMICGGHPDSLNALRITACWQVFKINYTVQVLSFKPVFKNCLSSCKKKRRLTFRFKQRQRSNIRSKSSKRNWLGENHDWGPERDAETAAGNVVG